MSDAITGLKWASNLDWSTALSRSMALTIPANTAATGAPTITGSAEVGNTLTAETSAIRDGDGLGTPDYTYQWLRVNGSVETNIGTDSETYAVVAADVGKKIKVKVSFEDRFGNAESLKSNATATVTETTSTNNPPQFTAGDSATRNLQENLGSTTTTTSTAIGAAFTATDADSADTVSYRLEGADSNAFALDTATGLLKTKVGVNYNHEAKATRSVTITADDGNGGSDSITVTVNITDRNEKSQTPAAPTVRGVRGEPTTLNVSWLKPDPDGGPDIIGYNVRHREAPDGSWTTQVLENGLATSTRITGLEEATDYEVQVLARNTETASEWSPASTGATGTAPINTGGGTGPKLQTHGNAVASTGSSITLYFDKTLDASASGTPLPVQFTVKADGVVTAVGAVRVSVNAVAGTNRVLLESINPTIRRSQSVTVSYTDASAADVARAIQDLDGNDASPFSDQPVSN